MSDRALNTYPLISSLKSGSQTELKKSLESSNDFKNEMYLPPPYVISREQEIQTKIRYTENEYLTQNIKE